MPGTADEISQDHPDGPHELSLAEKIWREHWPYLKRSGYELRPRYRPGWIPSWMGKPEGAWVDAEDALTLPLRNGVIDAIRISDGALVYIKSVPRDSRELEIADFLRSDELRKDPRNCCVPIEVLRDVPAVEGDSEPVSFIVMPFLRYIDSPGFERVGDVLQCGEQLLEGLTFLHEHNVAHRDCAFKNIMMDASALYPYGHHPIHDDFLPDDSRRAPVRPRAGAPIRYYFTDFGISTRFPADASAEEKLVVGTLGLDRSPPELHDTVRYDPFKLDVYLLGNVFKKHFVEKYRNLRMLEPLVMKMTDRDPAKRPTASEALSEWHAVRKRTSTIHCAWRLQPRSEAAVVRVVRNAFYPLYMLYTFLRLALTQASSPLSSPPR